MVDKKKVSRLMALRFVGIAMLFGTVYIVWFGVKEDRPRDFWKRTKVDGPVDLFSEPGLWRDQTGTIVSLSSFRGRTSIVVFVYAKCRVSCPAIVAELKNTEGKLEASGLNPRYLIFLFDSGPLRKHPGPEFLKRYGIKNESWRVLLADRKTVRRLAKQFKLLYKKTKKGRNIYLHTNFFAVVAANGKTVFNYRGLPYDKDLLVSAVKRARQ